jgi:hypothetical protein
MHPSDPPPEPIFTPRLQLGFGLLAFGLGLMFLAGKVLPAPVPAAIAAGIALAIAGFVVVVAEALRDPAGQSGPDGASPGGGAAAR